MSRTLEKLTDRSEIARVVCRNAADLVEADTAALLVRSVEGPRMLWHHPDGNRTDDLWGPATLGALFVAGRPVREVLRGDPLVGSASTALLAIPVPSGGILAGVLLARRVIPRSFSSAEEDVLARLARMAGAALDAANRRGQVPEVPHTDPVTGLWSRDRLLGDLRTALRSAQVHGMPTSLVLAEVAGLRESRRTTSDPKADAVLSGLARAVVAELRVGDVPYRFGHDELAVLLPGTELDEARVVAARLRERLPDAVGGRQVRTGEVAVEGIAEDIVLAAVRSLADAAREPDGSAPAPARRTRKAAAPANPAVPDPAPAPPRRTRKAAAPARRTRKAAAPARRSRKASGGPS